MLTCIHNGKQINSMMFYNKHDIKKWELISVYKNLSKNKELLCEECNRPVYIAAGDKKVVCFAHYSSHNKCSYILFKDEETREAVRQMYRIINGFDIKEIKLNFNISDINRKIHIYFEMKNEKVGLVYIKSKSTTLELKELINSYKKHGIKIILVFSSTYTGSTHIKHLVEKDLNQPVLCLLDIKRKQVILKRFLYYLEKYKEEFEMIFDSEDIMKNRINIYKDFNKGVTKSFINFKVKCDEKEQKEQKLLNSFRRQAAKTNNNYREKKTINQSFNISKKQKSPEE